MTFSFGGGAAGATPATTTGFTLGAPPAKAPAAGFGSAAPAAATPAFGGFGAPAAASTPAPAFGGFGSTATSAPTAAVAPTFGGAAATATTAQPPAFGGFGAAAAATTTTAPPAFGSFGAGAAAATTTTAAAPAFGGGFGAPAASSAAPAFGGFGAAAKTTAAAPAFGGFGATATATAAAPAPAFGAATSTTTATATLGFGGATAAAGSLGGFGVTSSTSTTTTVSGLGGNTTGGAVIGAQGAQQQGKAAEDTKTDASSSKESPIPAELSAVVEALKTVIKEEKSVSSELSHTTDKQMVQVRADTEALQQMVTGLCSTLQNNRLKLDQLKLTCGQELANVDICVKTRDTPPSMQYDNVAPLDYFSRLVAQFEQSMLEYRQAIQSAELHLQAVTQGSPGLSAEDIVSAVQRLHQALTHLAAKYQVIHTTINEYKSQFRVQSKTSSVPPASLSGPSPFLSPADPLTLARQSLTSHGPPVQSLGQQQSAFNTFGAAAAQQPAAAAAQPAATFNTSGFGAGATSAFGSSGFGAAANTGFGASSNTSVTVGTKRNKH